MAAKQDPPPPPEGRTPFDGLEPRAFFAEWPNGELVPPAEFESYPFTPAQRTAWLNGLELYRDLILDYRHYVATRKRQSVADATGISTNTLSNLNTGKRFAKNTTYLALRALLPAHTTASRNQAEREARRQELADDRWVEKAVQDRIDAAVQRRLEAEQRRPRPRR